MVFISIFSKFFFFISRIKVLFLFQVPCAVEEGKQKVKFYLNDENATPEKPERTPALTENRTFNVKFEDKISIFFIFFLVSDENLMTINESSNKIQSPKVQEKKTIIDSKFSAIFDLERYSTPKEDYKKRDEELKKIIKNFEEEENEKTDMTFLFGDDDIGEQEPIKDKVSSSSSSSSSSSGSDSSSDSEYDSSDADGNKEETNEKPISSEEFCEIIAQNELEDFIESCVKELLFDSLKG